MVFASVRQKLLAKGPRQLLMIMGAGMFSLTILGVLVYREREIFLEYNWQLRWHFVGQSFMLFTVALIITALLWADIMRVLGSSLPTQLHVRYYFISHIAKRLPGTVWYIASRGLLYKQHNESLQRVTVGTGLEFVMIFLAGVFVSTTAALFSLVHLSHNIILGLTGLTVVGLMAVHPRCIKWLMQRINITVLTDWGYIDLLRWLIGYVLLYVLGGTVFFLIGNAIINIEYQHVAYVIGSWSLVGTLSVLVFFLPSNLGFMEVGLSLLLSTIISPSLAVLIVVIARLLTILYEIISVTAIVLLLKEQR